MADSQGGSVLEGFLCPICVHDLGSVAELKDHFEQSHAGEDKALLNQLKGLFGKAKKKLLRQEIESSSNGVFTTATGVGGESLLSGAGAQAYHASFQADSVDLTVWDPQELGVTRCLTDSFKASRSSRIDRFVVETNKLLIRLDKLVANDAPTEPNKRKAYEKSIVSWAPDSDVTLCTTCGKSFTLTRRRHHCRLCGRILCNKCSHFLPFDFAKKMTNPAFSYEGDGFRRSGSTSSLNSSFSPDGDAHIRTCKECRFLLERRDEQTSSRLHKPLLVQIYERIHQYMEEAEQILPRYTQMTNSLISGETTHTVADAQKLKQQLTKLYETIAALNKRILALGQDSPDTASPKSIRLQQMIGARTSAFLQENLLGLPVVPTEEEHAQAQARKRAEAQLRIAEERRLAAERERGRREREEQQAREAERERQAAAATATANAGVKYRVRGGMNDEEGVEVAESQQGSGRGGWKPSVTARVKDTDADPMVQQMNIIRGYITEAKGAGRWDEVVMLEDNLKELQAVYWDQ